MFTDSVNVDRLFGPNVQYRIPLFQRRYVWNEVEWKHLWADIVELSFANQGHPQQNRKQHFTGTIVTREEAGFVGRLPTSEIIDGQQRLITFQIILCVLREVCVSHDYMELADAAARYLLNGPLLANEPDGRYKFIPTAFDRPSFVSLIDGDVGNHSGHISEAYSYFLNKIVDYVGNDREEVLSLFQCVLYDFSFIHVILSATDEPGQIFESLNASGRRLSEFDHLKNNLFLQLGEGSQSDAIYHMYWSPFDTDPFWTAETLHRFLRDFLRAKMGPEAIASHGAYDVYQRLYRPSLGFNLDIKDVENEFAELKRYADVYKMMNDPESRVGSRMQFYVDHKVIGLFSFILFIINELKVSDESLDRIFDVLESYIVRCLLCVGQKRAEYVGRINRFFSQVVKGIDFSLDSLVKHLAESKVPNKWPTDQRVKSALRKAGIKNLRLISYILYRIELIKRANWPLVDTKLSLDGLGIEHIMPANWEKTWSLPMDIHDLHQAKRERDNSVQSIGNLTLATKNDNRDMANRPFSEKIVLLRDSGIIMNREISLFDEWGVAQIREREEDLFRCFCKIWPSPMEF